MNRLALMLLRNWFRLPGVFTKLCRRANHPERYTEDERYAIVRHIAGLALKSGNVELLVTGRENVPTQGGCMLYSNHQGLFDIVAIGATVPRSIGVVMKKEVANVPLVRQVRLATHSYAMDRGDVRQSLKVIQGVTGEVAQGRCFLIFPEGTRSRQGNTMGEFHGGSFRCATKSHCPIVPCALIDSFRALDEKGSRPIRVQLHYLEPIEYEEYKDMNTTELASLVKERIRLAIEKNREG